MRLLKNKLLFFVLSAVIFASGVAFIVALDLSFFTIALAVGFCLIGGYGMVWSYQNWHRTLDDIEPDANEKDE